MDICDKAEALEQQQRQRALNNALNRPLEHGRIIDGTKVCICCDEPIPATRLHAAPNAVRCIDCQALEEAYGNG